MSDRPEPTDPLEAELRAFAPVAPRRDFADRVGREMRKNAGAGRAWRWWGAAGAVAAAACIGLAVVLLVPSRRPGRGGLEIAATTAPAPTATGPSSPVVGSVGDDRPALANYRRALSRSPEALDELLDRHAARLLPGATYGAAADVRITASSRIDLLR